VAPGIGTVPTNCFAGPYVCSFPDPAHTWMSGDNAWESGNGGVGPYCDSQLAALISCTPNTAVACSALPHTSAGGALSGTVSDTDITGSVTVSGGVTLHDDCITVTGTNVARSGSAAVALLGGTSTITATTISSVNDSQMMEYGVQNVSGNTATLQHDYVHDFGETLNSGNWDVSDSYIFTTNGSFAYNGSGAPGPCTSQCPESTQDVYFNAGTTATFTHDTMLNPHGEDILTESGQRGGEGAVIFGDDYSNAPCSQVLTVTGSLLAGGDSVITTCGNGKAPSAGTSNLDITNNDYARCTTATIGVSASGDTSSVTCQGATVPATASDSGGGVFPGADSHGYAPNGGGRLVNGIQYCVGTVSGNYWDDTGQTAAQSGTGTLPLNTCGNTVSDGGPSSAVASSQATASSPASGIPAPSPPGIRALLATILAPHGKTARIRALLRHGGYSFTWTAPSAGRLVISWYARPRHRARVLVATVRRSFPKAETASITIALTPAGRRLLRSARKLTLSASVSFTPAGGSGTTLTKGFTVTR
jgi:hypothetical protein